MPAKSNPDIGKIGKVLDLIAVDQLHHYKEIEKNLDWSSATVTKYLTSTIDMGLTEKRLTKEDRPGYFLTDLGDNLASIIGHKYVGDSTTVKHSIKKQNKKWEKLAELGIFEKGIDQKDALEFAKYINNNHKDENIDTSKPMITNVGYALSTITYDFPGSAHNVEIELSIKIDSNLEKFKVDLNELQEILDKLDYEED